MAGNGREWLRDVHGLNENFLPHVLEGDNVVIWGKSFVDPVPFLFHGDDSDIKRLSSRPYTERVFDVGFRVVIETVDSSK
jgi:hypothetical protein